MFDFCIAISGFAGLTFFLILIQFYVPFKIISVHMRRKRWAKTGEPREKPPGTPASRTWLVSHVASALNFLFTQGKECFVRKLS